MTTTFDDLSGLGEAIAPAPTTQAKAAAPLTPAGAIDELLRDQLRLLRRIEAGQDLVVIARGMLLTILASAASVGVSVGMFRGGVQVLLAGVKLPLVVLLTAAIVAPVYPAMKRALQQHVSLREDFTLLLSALALASLVTASLCPVLLYAIFSGVAYHALVLLCVAVTGVGGAAGYSLFFKGMNRRLERGHRVISVTLLCALALVGAQLSWVMRPYLVRPAEREVPVVRAIEGSFLGAVSRTTQTLLSSGGRR